jgi:hypothetical protein
MGKYNIEGQPLTLYYDFHQVPIEFFPQNGLTLCLSNVIGEKNHMPKQ